MNILEFKNPAALMNAMSVAPKTAANKINISSYTLKSKDESKNQEKTLKSKLILEEIDP
jgi:hypothetical protein